LQHWSHAAPPLGRDRDSACLASIIARCLRSASLPPTTSWAASSISFGSRPAFAEVGSRFVIAFRGMERRGGRGLGQARLGSTAERHAVRRRLIDPGDVPEHSASHDDEQVENDPPKERRMAVQPRRRRTHPAQMVRDRETASPWRGTVPGGAAPLGFDYDDVLTTTFPLSTGKFVRVNRNVSAAQSTGVASSTS